MRQIQDLVPSSSKFSLHGGLSVLQSKAGISGCMSQMWALPAQNSPHSGCAGVSQEFPQGGHTPELSALGSPCPAEPQLSPALSSLLCAVEVPCAGEGSHPNVLGHGECPVPGLLLLLLLRESHLGSLMLKELSPDASADPSCSLSPRLVFWVSA